MKTYEQARAHIGFKRAGRELKDDIADRMLAYLDAAEAAGKGLDYQAALKAATWPPTPEIVYHTADSRLRDQILAEGLLPCDADKSPHWRPEQNAGQPRGVYAAAKPDTIGVWAHWPAWDVWQIDTIGLTATPDLMNPGCYVLAESVSPTRLTLLHPGLSHG